MRVISPAGFADAQLTGSGATSHVFRATETKSGRTVALKRLHRHLVRSSESLARLRRELDALCQLRHPGIVGVRDVIRWEQDPTLVMDFVEGEDLREKIVRSGPLCSEEVLGIARSLFDILATAHASGIVHRDVKPQNIRIAADGRVFLLDFGSARLDASAQLTATGTTVGTPEYMAPELFVGPVYDPRADLFGAGATLFECVTGRPPQSADSLAELACVRTTVDSPPVRTLVKSVPAPLAAVIDRCLSRAPEDRFASAALALWALDHHQAHRHFAARRSAFPPCLHCGTPIPDDSVTCGSCRSDHPFYWAAGHSHIEITSLQDPVALIEHVAFAFPERCTPAEIRRLAEDCTALSSAPRRYASFIERKEAERITEKLAEIGVHGRISEEPRIRPWTWAMGLLLVLSMAVVTATRRPPNGPHWLQDSLPETLAQLLTIELMTWKGLALVLLVFLADRLRGLQAASKGLLSGLGRRKASRVAIGLAFVAATVTTLFVCFEQLGLHECKFYMRGSGLFSEGRIPRWAEFGCPWLLSDVGLLLPFVPLVVAAVILSLSSRLRKTRASPEIAFPGRLFRAAAAPFRIGSRGPEQAAQRRRLAAYVTVLALAIPFPLEILLITRLAESPGTYQLAPSNPVRALIERPSSVATEPATSGTRARGSSSARELASINEVDRFARNPIVLSALVALALFVLFHGARAARRSTDKKALLARLDQGRLKAWGRRSVPKAKGARLRAEDRLAAVSAGDPFLCNAVRKTMDLSRCLAEPATTDLRHALERMAERPDASSAARAWLARCILETDPEQSLRFEFLALEGRLEAEAAVRWSRQIEERSR